MNIHPTAVIAAGAKIADDVQIGPYAIVESGARIEAGCRIAGHAQILGSVELGESCQVGNGSVIGGEPQDFSFVATTTSSVVVGAQNVFREHVTVHRGSSEGSSTRIGNRNYIMVGSHVGHDAMVGDDNTMANQCLLGGHVVVGNSTFLGGGSAFHQFVRVGSLCMVKGLTAISQDVPPFVILSGDNQVRGLNNIGMRRSGLDRDTRRSIKLAFCIMLRDGLNIDSALDKAGGTELRPEAEAFVDFFRTPSRKGICRLLRAAI